MTTRPLCRPLLVGVHTLTDGVTLRPSHFPPQNSGILALWHTACFHDTGRGQWNVCCSTYFGSWCLLLVLLLAYCILNDHVYVCLHIIPHHTHTHTHARTYARSASEMTYIVSGGALNSTHSLTRTHARTHTHTTILCTMNANL